MSRPHVARLAENAWNQLIAQPLRARGWQPTFIAHQGYAGQGFVRVMGRLLLTRPLGEDRGRTDADYESRRGWRNFFTAEVAGAAIAVTIGDRVHHLTANSSGLIDARFPNPGLAVGHHELRVEVEGGADARAPIQVIAPGVTFGLVSDIDDTVLRTSLPRPLLAAYHTFVLTESARRPVRGMAHLYADLLAAHPQAPTFYVSTGAWNTFGMLTRFLAEHDFPRGPLLLTDWGPTNTGWFRSGQDHKRACLAALVADFPHIRWLLVGDDGQHDPSLYAEFAAAHPDSVRAIAIRQLGRGEHLLAHGTATSQLGEHQDLTRAVVPEVRAPDGQRLLAALRAQPSGVLDDAQGNPS